MLSFQKTYGVFVKKIVRVLLLMLLCPIMVGAMHSYASDKTQTVNSQISSQTTNDNPNLAPDSDQSLSFTNSDFGFNGPLSIGAQWSKNYGFSIQGKYTQAFSKNNAFSAGLEVGGGQNRLGFTWGHAFTSNQRIKLTAERLGQHMDFDFDSGDTTKWVYQNAVGGTYQYLLNHNFIKDINLNAFYSKASSQSLSNRGFTQNNTPWINYRNIAGATDKSASLGVNLTPTKNTLIGLQANYDNVNYDTKYISEKDSSGLGATVSLDQLITKNAKLGLLASNRKIYDDYEVNFSWLLTNIPGSQLEVGLLGKRIIGKQGNPNDVSVGLNFAYSWGLDKSEASAGYTMQSDNSFADLASWTSEPAVHMEQVLAIKDQTSRAATAVQDNKPVVKAASNTKNIIYVYPGQNALKVANQTTQQIDVSKYLPMLIGLNLNGKKDIQYEYYTNGKKELPEHLLATGDANKTLAVDMQNPFTKNDVGKTYKITVKEKANGEIVKNSLGDASTDLIIKVGSSAEPIITLYNDNPHWPEGSAVSSTQIVHVEAQGEGSLLTKVEYSKTQLFMGHSLMVNENPMNCSRGGTSACDLYISSMGAVTNATTSEDFQVSAYGNETPPDSPVTATWTLSVDPSSPTHMQYDPAPPSSAAVGASVSTGVQLMGAQGSINKPGDTIRLTLDHGTFSDGQSYVEGSTDANGKATINFTVNTAGTYSITATDETDSSLPALASDSFNITSASKLVFLGASINNTTVGSGNLLRTTDGNSIQVALEDSDGHIVESADEPVTIQIASGPDGTTLHGNAVEVHPAAGTGIVTFSDLYLEKNGTYTLKATSTGLQDTPESNLFTVNHDEPDHLGYGQQPSATQANTNIAPPVTVEVQDQYNNKIDNDGAYPITLELGNNSCSGTLTGADAGTYENGVAKFSSLQLDNTCSGYTLKAKATLQGQSKEKESSAFNIVSGQATQLKFLNEPKASMTAGDMIWGADDNFMEVQVQDANGNPMTDQEYTVTITVNSGPEGGQVIGTLTAVAEPYDNGIAIFDDLSIEKANLPTESSSHYSLKVSSGNLQNAVTNNFDVDHTNANGVALSPSDPQTLAPEADLTFSVIAADTYGNAWPMAANQCSEWHVSPDTLGSFDNQSSHFVAGANEGNGEVYAANCGGAFGTNHVQVEVASTGASSVAFETQPPATVSAGTKIPEIDIKVENNSGGPVEGQQVSVNTDPAANFTSGSTLTATSGSDGVARFDNLTIEKAQQGYKIRAELVYQAPKKKVKIFKNVNTESNSFDVVPADAIASVQLDANDLNPQVAAGSTYQFHAHAYDQYNNEKTDVTSFVWQLSADGTNQGDSVDENGLFTASTNNLGERVNEVTASSDGVSSASASVTVVPAALDHISITSADAKNAVVVGKTLQFNAKGYDAHNNEIDGLGFAWDLSQAAKDEGNSIDSNTGLFTANSNNGGAFNDGITARSVEYPDVSVSTTNVKVKAPNNIDFAAQPSTTEINQVMIPAPAVQLKDADGENIAMSGDTVTLTLYKRDGTAAGVVFTGTTGEDGSVIFDGGSGDGHGQNISIATANIDYHLRAADVSRTLPVEHTDSNEFNIMPTETTLTCPEAIYYQDTSGYCIWGQSQSTDGTAYNFHNKRCSAEGDTSRPVKPKSGHATPFAFARLLSSGSNMKCVYVNNQGRRLELYAAPQTPRNSEFKNAGQSGISTTLCGGGDEGNWKTANQCTVVTAGI
jgi:hypothetical protein